MVNEEAIKKSFLKIKEDMENLKQENDYCIKTLQD